MKANRNGRQQQRRLNTRAPQLWHPDVPGPLWDGSRRVDRRQIRAYCAVLAREFHPQKIILFGSYAAGRATRVSDVDLLLVMGFHGNSTDQVVKIRGRAEAPFPLDLLICKPRDLLRQDSFTRAIKNEGKVMYEGGHA